MFVQLTAPDEVLLKRVTDSSRQQHGKLLDPVRLQEMLELLDPAPLHPDDLVINTSAVSPGAAATAIAAACE